ncbi:calnexin 14d-related [Anaeramoeba flamelloides]|uniref:Calnexin 14d-related n=1 Tax=Anaeramoeba flamelloides TaxID=1746091 RepID=A0ABQ8XPE0_9EUKA|nr:calnexin 14d-related [Anaeramoeba flamelloides]
MKFLFLLFFILFVLSFCHEQKESESEKKKEEVVFDKLKYEEMSEAIKSHFHFYSYFGEKTKIPKEWVATKNKNYQGKWKIQESANKLGREKDTVLMATSDRENHGISTRFEKPFDPKKEGFLIQFETRFDQISYCQRLSVNLLPKFQRRTYTKDINYVFGIGPENCGKTSLFHMSYHKKNPINEKWEKHEFKSYALCEKDNVPHTYTFVVNKNNENYDLYKDGRILHRESIVGDFNNWHKELMLDHSHKKPRDWVTNRIISDPSDEQPKDWDKKTMGKYKRKTMVNPEYKGPWIQRKIKDPNYYVDDEPWKFQKIYGIAIDAFTLNGGVGIDNIIFGSPINKEMALEYAEYSRRRYLFEEWDSDYDESKKNRSPAQKMLSKLISNYEKDYLQIKKEMEENPVHNEL